jgi:hypothetical protein
MIRHVKIKKERYLYTVYKNGALDIPEISALHEIDAVQARTRYSLCEFIEIYIKIVVQYF